MFGKLDERAISIKEVRGQGIKSNRERHRVRMVFQSSV